MNEKRHEMFYRDCLFCPNHERGWHYVDVGEGRPLILLHGIGMSHFAWKNVIDKLANERRVLAFDIAGFGLTPPVPDDVQPTPANLVGSLAETLSRIDDERRISEEYECAGVVGNSLGGFMALEAAKAGRLGCFRVESIAAISPAGLWKTRYPVRPEIVLQLTRIGVRHFPRMTNALLGWKPTRQILMAVPASTNVPAEDARELINIFASAPIFASKVAFMKFRECLKDPFIGGGASCEGTRVTIAFGKRDWLIPPSARRRHEIPANVIWQDRSGWGHVPMYDDPEGVTKFILEAIA